MWKNTVSRSTPRSACQRAIDITGVMPMPAESSSSFSALMSQQLNLPLATTAGRTSPARQVIVKPVRHHAARHTLDGERDEVRPRGRRRDGVVAPHLLAGDVDLERDELSGLVAERPLLVGREGKRLHVGGFVDDANALQARVDRIPRLSAGDDRRLPADGFLRRGPPVGTSRRRHRCLGRGLVWRCRSKGGSRAPRRHGRAWACAAASAGARPCEARRRCTAGPLRATRRSLPRIATQPIGRLAARRARFGSTLPARYCRHCSPYFLDASGSELTSAGQLTQSRFSSRRKYASASTAPTDWFASATATKTRNGRSDSDCIDVYEGFSAPAEGPSLDVGGGAGGG